MQHLYYFFLFFCLIFHVTSSDKLLDKNYLLKKIEKLQRESKFAGQREQVLSEWGKIAKKHASKKLENKSEDERKRENKLKINKQEEANTENDVSGFIDNKKPWNTYSRRVQLYIGGGYFVKMVKSLKCPIISKHITFHPLHLPDGRLNVDRINGMIFKYKNQPSENVAKKNLKNIRYETGLVIYSGNAASLNFNFSIDPKKYKFYLDKIPHSKENINDLTLTDEKIALVNGNVPPTYVATYEINDLLGSGRNCLKQTFEYEATIGFSFAKVEKYWFEFCLGLSNALMKGYFKNFHMLSIILGFRFEYELSKSFRIGLSYQFRKGSKKLTGFDKISSRNHLIITSIRFMFP